MTSLNHPYLQLIALFTLSCLIKLLLIPAYFSTDFDVHQNWLRITHNQPIQQWYFDDQSPWTLDYPPLFAFFQYFLAKISVIVSPSIAATINRQWQTILFQRISVIFSQIPYLIVLYKTIGSINYKLIIAYFSLPLILLDNIHFQYNIIMQAIFIYSVYSMQQTNFLRGAFFYSVLINFKHIYIYAALAFFLFILKQYVLKAETNQEKIKRLVKVGCATIVPFIVAFMPFLCKGGVDQLQQIFARLFPFQRGLIHEYWAPNFWAIYYFIDKLTNILFLRFFAAQSITTVKDVGMGLHFLKILPQPSALATTIIILLVTLPLLYLLFRKGVQFYKYVFVCGMVFFMFGYHVHQKAITPYVNLLLVFMHLNTQNKRNSLIFSAIFVNTINLLPLLINPNEKVLRIVLPILWLAVWDYFNEIDSNMDRAITAVGTTVVLYQQLVHPFMGSTKLAFVPLMLNSVFAATFNICWLTFCIYQEMTRKQGDKLQEYQSVNQSQVGQE